MINTNKIIIVGGGSAGWMAASTLISQFPNKDITVIESPNTPTVGVGESTLGHINDWMALLGIKDEDFMPHCDASYKLSIRFEDFYKKGDGGYHYPFGNVLENHKIGTKEHWFAKKKQWPETPCSDYAEKMFSGMVLVKNNVLFKNEDNLLPDWNFQYHTAYHFDATKFGIWLRENYCKPRGVKHILENIDTIEQDDNGIKSLNNKHTADMYIDCTGFKSLLLGETLKEPFNDYTKLLPNNKAWATRVPYKNKEEELQPYTNCTAIENGWVWNIPSWKRIGTGYVYSDKYVSDEEALNEFKRHLDKKGSDYSNSEFKNIKMRVGIHDRIFVKNVCAIGLSAGFIEPLESNGLLSVHEFLTWLVKVMRRGDQDKISRWDIDNFNKTCRHFFDGFTDFVAKHYALSHREDTKYWRDISNKSFLDVAASSEMGADILAKMKDGSWFRGDAGFHCISTGMRYFAIDVFEKEIDNNTIGKINLRDKLHNQLLMDTKNKPSLLKYLKDNIHNGTI